MPEQIDLARQNYPGYDFRVQSATDLSGFDSASRDVVVIFGVLHHIPAWRRVLDEITCVLRTGGSLFIEEPRGVELKMFDFIFRWGHPDTDFGLKVFERYCSQQGLHLIQKRWTPLLTMYHWQKGGK
jgi:SAM-dependent methyltransferase